MTLAVASRPAPDPAPILRLRRIRRRRYAAVVAGLTLLVVVTALIELSVGDFMVSLPDVVRALAGGSDPTVRIVVRELRLPRVVLAVVAGATLALSGALFQTLLRNPLASPDILGVTGGATVASVVATTIAGLSGLAVSGLAFAGALVVAGLIRVLAGSGAQAGQRFVLVGVGVAFMVTAVLGWVLTRADVQQAQLALSALVGGVGNADRTTDLAALGGLAVFGALAAAAGRTLRSLQLDDDTATGLGLAVERRRTLLLALAVALAAVGVAGAGPLAFVAFTAPQIARRLLGTGAPTLLPSALTGALIVIVSDLASQHLPGGNDLPAGVLTGALGAVYLLTLLARRSRTEAT